MLRLPKPPFNSLVLLRAYETANPRLYGAPATSKPHLRIGSHTAGRSCCCSGHEIELKRQLNQAKTFALFSINQLLLWPSATIEHRHRSATRAKYC